MDLPKCCTTKCLNISSFYVEKKKKYACQSCAQSKFWDQQKEFLIDPRVPRNTLKGLSECIKLFTISVHEDEDTMEEAKAFFAKYDDEIKDLNTKFGIAMADSVYHHYAPIQKEALTIFDSLKKEKLYNEFTAKCLHDWTLEYASSKDKGNQQLSNARFEQYEGSLPAGADDNPIFLSEEIIHILNNFHELIEQEKHEIRNRDQNASELKDSIFKIFNNTKDLLKHIEGLQKKELESIIKQDEVIKAELKQRDKAVNEELEESRRKEDDLREQILRANQEIERRDQMIMELNQEKERLIELNDARVDPEVVQTIELPENEIYDIYEFRDFLNRTLGPNSDNLQGSSLHLNVNRKSDEGLILASEKRFPNSIKQIIIGRLLGFEKDVLKQFLLSSLPSDIETFCFGWDSCGLINFSHYFSEIFSLRASITKELFIWDFRLSQYQVMKIIEGFKHLKTLHFTCCLLEIESVPDFEDTLEGSQISHLDFDRCGGGRHSWKRDPSPFINLMTGLGYSDDFRDSLKTVGLNGCNLTKPKTRQILNQSSFEHVRF
ncbi:unnamed protein product [Moneuplotes crassus]|uniref:Uncharacterized protein n=1 Tax=Euplotes crassus TaxID=5936 RepID=A0AAD1U9T9_EUPCR|nr:unnamed protein product [Moneuplotes crassus]